MLDSIGRRLRQAATQIDSLISGEYPLEPGLVYEGWDSAVVERLREQLHNRGIPSMIRESCVSGGEGVAAMVCVFQLVVPLEAEAEAKAAIAAYKGEATGHQHA
jgi:hypothetical protein